MFRAFLKDCAIYAFPAIISRGLTFFLVPLYTRVLSPADYGSLDMFMVFAAIIKLTIALEVSQGVARFYAAETDPQHKAAYASSAFWFTLASYNIFAILALIFTDPLAHWIMGQPNLDTAFQIGIVYIWISGLFYLVQNQFRWELRSKNYSMVSLLMSLVTAVVSIWLAYDLRWGIEGLLLGMVGGNLVGTALGLWWLRNSFRFYFDVARLCEMLRFSIPLVLSGIAVWISLYIDRLMINHFLSINEVGLYSIGYRLASIAGLVMIGFQGSLTPLIYTYYRKSETPRQLSAIFRFFIASALIMFIGLSLFATDILRLFTTESFYGGAVVVIYLVPALLLANMYIFAPGIDIAKKTHLIVWINVAGAIFNALLNWLLIPIQGIEGAGLATLLGYLFVFSVYMFFSQRFYYVPHQWKALALSIIVAIVLVVVVPKLSRKVNINIGLNILALALMCLTILTTGLIHFSEVKQLKQILLKQFLSRNDVKKSVNSF